MIIVSSGIKASATYWDYTANSGETASGTQIVNSYPGTPEACYLYGSVSVVGSDGTWTSWLETDMDSLSNRQKILKWLSENKIIVEDEEKIDDDSLKAISLCIEYYNQIDKNEKKHRNDLVDEEDELVDIYSDYNFNGKIGVPISHKKDIIHS